MIDCYIQPFAPHTLQGKMHPALVILIVVFSTHIITLIGRDRIQRNLLPVYTRLFHSADLKTQRQLKKSLYETRQQLNKTSSQDEFAKWAKLRRTVDKMVSQLEATNSRLSSASATLSILLRVFLFLTTTLFPFVLTFYFGKTPMFFLPPSETATRTMLSSASTRTTRMAPGGFVIPNNPNHAWEMINETYLGPFGWFLSLTAAPRGSVSAGMWSTVCTRIALLITARLQELIVALTTLASSSTSSKVEAEKATPVQAQAQISEINSEKTDESTSKYEPPSETLRKRTAAGVK